MFYEYLFFHKIKYSRLFAHVMLQKKDSKKRSHYHVSYIKYALGSIHTEKQRRAAAREAFFVQTVT